MDMSYIAREINEDQLRAKGFAIKPDKFGNAALGMIASVSNGQVTKPITLQANHDLWTLNKAKITQAKMIDITGGGNTIVFFALITGDAKWETVGGRGVWSVQSKDYDLKQAVASNLTIKECPSIVQSYIQDIDGPVLEVPETGSIKLALNMLLGNTENAIYDAAKLKLEPIGQSFTVSFPISTILAN